MAVDTVRVEVELDSDSKNPIGALATFVDAAHAAGIYRGGSLNVVETTDEEESNYAYVSVFRDLKSGENSPEEPPF